MNRTMIPPQSTLYGTLIYKGKEYYVFIIERGQAEFIYILDCQTETETWACPVSILPMMAAKSIYTYAFCVVRDDVIGQEIDLLVAGF